MRPHRVLLSTLVFTLVATVFADDGKLHRSHRPVPNQCIVVLEDSPEPVAARADEIVAAHSGRAERIFDGTPKGFLLDAPAVIAVNISGDRRVKYVQELSLARLSPLRWRLAWARDTSI